MKKICLAVLLLIGCTKENNVITPIYIEAKTYVYDYNSISFLEIVDETDTTFIGVLHVWGWVFNRDRVTIPNLRPHARVYWLGTDLEQDSVQWEAFGQIGNRVSIDDIRYGVVPQGDSLRVGKFCAHYSRVFLTWLKGKQGGYYMLDFTAPRRAHPKTFPLKFTIP